MSTPNPLSHAWQDEQEAVSKEEFCIAGILTTVYGLEQIPADTSRVACLWLLHPRLQTQECMEPIARSMVGQWDSRRQSNQPTRGPDPLGLIAVSFDQRNHGSRIVQPLANEAWRSGNKSGSEFDWIKDGTAMDTSLLLDHIDSYIFPRAERRIVTNMVLGISLGGHSAWQCLVHEPRITAGVIGIGCPDYVRLMSHRAAKSKLDSWTAASKSGIQFIGSSDFPPSLVEAVRKWDPAGLLMDDRGDKGAEIHDLRSKAEFEQQRQTTEKHLGGKKILNLSGGADKLVPYSCSKPFLQFLEAVTTKDTKLEIQDRVYDGVGHEMTREMIEEARRFVYLQLERAETERGE